MKIDRENKVFAGRNEPVKASQVSWAYERFSLGSLILEARPEPCHTQRHTMLPAL